MLPWLAGLMLGTWAHITWWTHARAVDCDTPRMVVVEAPRVDRSPDDAPPPVADLSPDRPDRCAPRSAAEPEAGSDAHGEIVCTETGCTIRRTFVRRVLHAPSLLGSPRRVVPVVEGDATIGVRLFGVPAGSVLELLGLRNGDTLVAVQGRPIAEGPTALLQTLRSLPDAPELVLDLRRGGQPHTLRARIIDEPARGRVMRAASWSCRGEGSQAHGAAAGHAHRGVEGAQHRVAGERPAREAE